MIFCGHAEWYTIFQIFKQIFFIHALELKLRHFEVFPICLYREAMHLQCFTPRRYVMGVVTRTYERDDLYPICSKLQCREPACITMHVATL